MSQQGYHIIEKCRVCGSAGLSKVIDLGMQPLANAFLTEEEIPEEKLFPLTLCRCRDCTHVQLRETVDPELMFRNYVYVSSTSPTFVSHFEKFAEDMVARLGLGPGSLVVDIGSNDGILLKPFQERGCAVMGVDPAVQIASQATLSGITTLCEFFTRDTARRIREDVGPANLVTATNVFAHTEEIYPILSAVKDLLAEGGVFVIEVPYVMSFLNTGLFDTIYHEHISYWSARALHAAATRAGFRIVRVEKVTTHGGSIRVTFKPSDQTDIVDEDVARFINEQVEDSLKSSDIFERFHRAVIVRRDKIVKFVKQERERGKRFVGYGAPAKGNTALNFYGLTDQDIEFIVDDSSWKQSLLTPGTHIPVVDLDYLLSLSPEEHPHYVAVLAWNYFEEIQQKLKEHGFTATCITL